MRCMKCGRKGSALIGLPSSPRTLVCEFCYPGGGIEGVTEDEPSEHRSGRLHRRNIDKLMAGNLPRVNTTASIGRPEVKDVG